MGAIASDLRGSGRWRVSASANRHRLRTCLVALVALVTSLALAGPALATPSTTVSLTFDDGRPSQLAAGQQLASRNMTGTFYVISSTVGRPGVMTLSDLNSLAAAGMEIGAHTVLHRDLPTLSSDEAKRELCLSRNWLMDRGFAIYDMAYPYDSTNASVEQSVAACGYNSARTGGQLLCDANHACAETMPPLDPYSLRTPLDFNQSTTLAQMKATVTNAESRGGGWVPLELHDVCDGPGDPLLPAGAQCPAPGVISRALYAQFLDWLKGEVDAGRVQVKTVHDVIGGPLAPQVVVDPVPVRAGNLLLNPSYEQSSTAGGPSSCWANISNGPDSPPTITTTTDAHEGAKALAISVPATYDSWAYNLIAPVLDLGQCAPTAIAGHRYTFTGWYKGNGQIRIVAYWRNADNQWTRVDWGTAGTATLPAATAWTKGTLAFLAPAGATAVSAGFYVDGTAVNRSAGNSYTIDDTSLVDDDAGQLSVATSGTGSGTVSSSPAGIDCGAACQFTFVNGATVTLTAAPAAGSGFTSWSGACSGASAACVVTTNAAKSVTATFTLLPVQLGVVKAGSGSGTVTSSPAGIACGSTCQATFVNGTTVTLTAAPSVDSTFTGWSGACAGAATQCVVSMSAARSVTATFTVKALLQVMRTGTGTGAVSGSAGGIACGATCQASFANGTTVTLTAVAAPGSSFAAWSGACSGTATTCSLDMTSDRTATATFTANAALAVAGAGSGTGVVAGDGASGIDCGGVCNAQLINGSTVTLAAVAAPGSTFLGWSGACSGTSAICTLLMTADRIAIASFALNPPPAPVVATAPVVPAVTPAVIPAVAPPVIVARVSARPVARVRPKVSGSARVRRTLVCTRGSWTGSPTRYVFTWRRDGKVVIAHGSAYHVRPADRGHGIRCEVTAVNAKGSTTASSGALHIAV